MGRNDFWQPLKVTTIQQKIVIYNCEKMNFVNFIIRVLSAIENRLRFVRYYYSKQKKIKVVRAKETIDVLFIVSDVSMWKTEGLYCEMLKHQRFCPKIGVSLIMADLPSDAILKYQRLVDYLKNKRYDFIPLYSMKNSGLNPDIIFYQQPYGGYISEALSFGNQDESLFCYVSYGFSSLSPIKKNSFAIDTLMHRYCWQIYQENELVSELNKVSLLKGRNCVITGLPMQDILSQPASSFKNPWMSQEKPKKRIIWAPHHTIPIGKNLLNYSTFLDVAEIMLGLAEKYSEEVQFAFKPHPFLKKKLVPHWGEKKTNEYYSKWQAISNGQLVEGDYLGLFKYSDAMIHDCGSFTVEYCYTKNPVMYLANEEAARVHRNELNRFGQMAFDLHTLGNTKEHIESFIISVINGEDSYSKERELYYEKYLLPPNCKSASTNIMNAILGIEEYCNQR